MLSQAVKAKYGKILERQHPQAKKRLIEAVGDWVRHNAIGMTDPELETFSTALDVHSELEFYLHGEGAGVVYIGARLSCTDFSSMECALPTGRSASLGTVAEAIEEARKTEKATVVFPGERGIFYDSVGPEPQVLTMLEFVNRTVSELARAAANHRCINALRPDSLKELRLYNSLQADLLAAQRLLEEEHAS